MEEVNQWLERGARAVSESDTKLFRVLQADMPEWEERDVPGSGAHSIRCFRWLAKLFPKAKRVLEIGFNMGVGSRALLWYGAERVVSLDIRNTERMQESAESIKSSRGDSFDFMLRDDDNGAYLNESFDLIFIDGWHEYDDVMKDIALGERLGIRMFFFDDWLPQYGPGVQRAAMDSGLLPIAIFGNMAVCVKEL